MFSYHPLSYNIMLRDYNVFSLLPARFSLIFSLCTIRTLVPIFRTCRFQFPLRV